MPYFVLGNPLTLRGKYRVINLSAVAYLRLQIIICLNYILGGKGHTCLQFFPYKSVIVPPSWSCIKVLLQILIVYSAASAS